MKRAVCEPVLDLMIKRMRREELDKPESSDDESNDGTVLIWAVCGDLAEMQENEALAGERTTAAHVIADTCYRLWKEGPGLIFSKIESAQTANRNGHYRHSRWTERLQTLEDDMSRHYEFFEDWKWAGWKMYCFVFYGMAVNLAYLEIIWKKMVKELSGTIEWVNVCTFGSQERRTTQRWEKVVFGMFYKSTIPMKYYEMDMPKDPRRIVYCSVQRD